MTPRRVRITQDRPNDARIFVDDHEISAAVRSYTVTATVNDRHPTVTLDLAVLDLRADLDYATVLITSATVDALIALGWTPPPEEAVDGEPG